MEKLAEKTNSEEIEATSEMNDSRKSTQNQKDLKEASTLLELNQKVSEKEPESV